MWKKFLTLTFGIIMCLMAIGGSIAYASSPNTSNTDSVFNSQPKQLKVTIEKPSDAKILADNKEYIDFIEVNLGSQAADKVKAQLLEPWKNIPSGGETITIDAVEISTVN
jgi:hypothetical protein